MVRRCVVTFLLAVLAVEQVAAQDPGQLELPADMGCKDGPRAATWLSIKNRFRTFFNGSNSPFKASTQEELAKVLEGAIVEANTVGALGAEGASECGFGKLFIQVMSIALIDEPSVLVQYISEKPVLSSPLLTLLLDIPWVVMAQSGWPFFGILAQVSYHKQRVLKGAMREDAIDGLGDDFTKAYFDIVSKSQESGDLIAMTEASGKYLKIPDLGKTSPFGAICAMSTQAAIQMDVKDRLNTLDIIQKSFRQTMSTPAELEIALTTRWPFWGFLHVAVDVFAE